MEKRKMALDISLISQRLNSRQNVSKNGTPSEFDRSHSTLYPVNAPSTNSNSGNVSATSTKFTIEQIIPSGSAKRGPYSVKRSVDPNEVVIKRRFGEGAKPLFSRDDIRVNNSIDDHLIEPDSKKKIFRSRKISSSSSSNSSTSSDEYVDERRRKHKCKHQMGKGSSKVELAKKNMPDKEKVPYFIDQKREIERIERIHEIRLTEAAKPKPSSRRRRRSYSSERNRERNLSLASPASSRRQTRTRSRSLSPSRVKHHSRSHDLYRQRETRRRSSSHTRKRRLSEGNHFERYQHRSRSTHSRSRSRDRGQRRDQSQMPQLPIALPQYIPVPVPMEYPCAYPPWPPQPSWPQPVRFGGFPIRPFLSQIIRRPPPPSSVRYFGQQYYRPPHRGNFQNRARHSFRPRNTNY